MWRQLISINPCSLLTPGVVLINAKVAMALNLPYRSLATVQDCPRDAMRIIHKPWQNIKYWQASQASDTSNLVKNPEKMISIFEIPVGNLASPAGVFRGDRISSLPRGGKKYDLP